METFFAILGGIGVIVGFIAFRNDHIKKPKEKLEAFIVHFDMNKALAAKLRNDLFEYAVAKHCMHKYFIEPITFEAYIKIIDAELSSGLSDQTLKNAIDVKFSDPILDSSIKSLQDQYSKLSGVSDYFKNFYLLNVAGV